MNVEWTERTIDSLIFGDFLEAFINERQREGQVARLKQIGRYTNWEYNKRLLFDDCKRVLRVMLDPRICVTFVNGLSADSTEDGKKELSALLKKPIAFYLSMWSVVYSYMKGNQLDYYRLPQYFKLLWSKNEFQNIMKYSM